MNWFNKKIAIAVGIVAAGAILYKIYSLDDQPNYLKAVQYIRNQINKGSKGPPLIKTIMQIVGNMTQNQVEAQESYFKYQVVYQYKPQIWQNHLKQILQRLNIPRQQFNMAAIKNGLSPQSVKINQHVQLLGKDIILKIIKSYQLYLQTNIAKILQTMMQQSAQLQTQKKLLLSKIPNLFIQDTLFQQFSLQTQHFQQQLKDLVKKDNQIKISFQRYSFKLKQYIIYYQQNAGLIDPAQMEALQRYQAQARQVQAKQQFSQPNYKKQSKKQQEFDTSKLSAQQLQQYKAMMT